MEEKTVVFEVRHFTGNRCLNGETRTGEQIYPLISAELIPYSNSLVIYPNGNKPENADYVSIEFRTEVTELERPFELESILTFSCVFSVVDICGNLRFSQSIGVAFKEAKVSGYFLLFEVDRIIGRRILLDASEELLPGDTLTLRFEVDLSYSSDYYEYEKFSRNLRDVARGESWYYIQTESRDRSENPFIQTEDRTPRLDLRNVNSPLCTRLREQSDFFRGLFQSDCKEMQDGYMAIEPFEFYDFDGMLGYVRFGNVQHIRDSSEFVGLYKQARFYGVRDLEEICIQNLKQNLPSDYEIEILRIADSRGDADLRTLAFKKALSEWENVRSSQEWKDLRLESPQLANELSSAAHILSLEYTTSLFNIAARQILQNRNLVQFLPNWSVFAKNLPDLAKVILEFDTYKFKQDDATDYNFYQ